MKLIDIESAKNEDARITPAAMLRNILAEMESGSITISRCAIVIEDQDGGFNVRASGWHGDDIAPAIFLLDIGKYTLYRQGDE